MTEIRFFLFKVEQFLAFEKKVTAAALQPSCISVQYYMITAQVHTHTGFVQTLQDWFVNFCLYVGSIHTIRTLPYCYFVVISKIAMQYPSHAFDFLHFSLHYISLQGILSFCFNNYHLMKLQDESFNQIFMVHLGPRNSFGFSIEELNPHT